MFQTSYQVDEYGAVTESASSRYLEVGQLAELLAMTTLDAPHLPPTLPLLSLAAANRNISTPHLVASAQTNN